jgi:3-hydroxyacyl-CoA dehydrogenase
MSTTKRVGRVAIVGTGVIGASWAALFLAKGLEVVATDIAPNAEPALKSFIATAWPALKRLGLAPGASQSRLTFTPDVAEAVRGADLVQENGPERIDFKIKLYSQLDELLPPDVIIASSSSGLTMSEIQSGCRSHPERCVIGHPFNPPHLIPLVEIVGGAKTSEETIQRALQFYADLGKQPVRLHMAAIDARLAGLKVLVDDKTTAHEQKIRDYMNDIAKRLEEGRAKNEAARTELARSLDRASSEPAEKIAKWKRTRDTMKLHARADQLQRAAVAATYVASTAMEEATQAWLAALLARKEAIAIQVCQADEP